MARIHRRAIQKDLNDPDNPDDVIYHLEPDILECEVKWALGSITPNKANGDVILAELFQILKDDAVKVLHSICQPIWKPQQCPQHWKFQLSLKSKEGQCQGVQIIRFAFFFFFLFVVWVRHPVPGADNSWVMPGLTYRWRILWEFSLSIIPGVRSFLAL